MADRSPKSSNASKAVSGHDEAIGSAIDRYSIFEKVALERLALNSETTKATSFLPLPVRMTAVAAVAIVSAGVMWSVVAKIPVQVNGIAAIVPEAGIRGLYAPTNGRIRYQVSGVTPISLDQLAIENNQAIREFWMKEYDSSPGQLLDGEHLAKLAEGALRSNPGQDLALPEVPESKARNRINPRPEFIQYPVATVLAFIIDPSAYQELNGVMLTSVPKAGFDLVQERERRLIAEEYKRLAQLTEQQQEGIKKELRDRQALYEKYKDLWRSGSIASTQLLEEQGTLNRLKDQLLQSRIAAATTEISHRDQVTQSRQAKISNIENRSALENGLIRFLERTAIFAPAGGFYLLASHFSNNSDVKQGDEIFSYTHTPPSLPKTIPIFLESAAAQQVSEGMKVLLTPKGVSRAQFGGIPGKVVEINKLPLLGDSLLAAIGSRAMVASIQESYKTPYLARVRLEIANQRYCQQALSLECYRWSSTRIPQHPVRLATLGDAQITTTYRRPIEFVMPALKRVLGLVVDN